MPGLHAQPPVHQSPSAGRPRVAGRHPHRVRAAGAAGGLAAWLGGGRWWSEQAQCASGCTCASCWAGVSRSDADRCRQRGGGVTAGVTAGFDRRGPGLPAAVLTPRPCLASSRCGHAAAVARGCDVGSHRPPRRAAGQRLRRRQPPCQRAAPRTESPPAELPESLRQAPPKLAISGSISTRRRRKPLRDDQWRGRA